MNKLDYIVLGAIITATFVGAAIFVIGDIGTGRAYAPPTSCAACAKNFAPGHIDDTSTEVPLEPKDDAPGQFNKKSLE